LRAKKKFRDRVLPVACRKIARNRFRLYVLAPLLRPIAFAGAKSQLADFEYCATSQHGEDGILDRIFSVIGFKSRVFVEFGFHPAESNALLLLYKKAFTGLFVDGDAGVCDLAKKILRRFVATGKLRIVNALLSPESIDAVIAANGISGEIDLLSIDVDSIDYWLWNAIRGIRPRVVVVEATQRLGFGEAVTQAPGPPRAALDDPALAPCRGASPRALHELGAAKGYRFLGSDSSGVNMFFLRADIATPDLAAVDLAQGFERAFERAFARSTRPPETVAPEIVAQALECGLLVRP
jgi:hypothetical protein